MERVQTNDTELVKRCKNNDLDAFTELVHRYQDRIYNVVFRFMGERQLAEDITQDVFIKAYNGLSGFQEKAAFSTWIYRIAVNQCTSEARRLSTRKRRQEVSLTPVDADGEEAHLDPGDIRENPAENVLASERVRVVQQAILTLDPEFREALVLRDIEGLSYEEIAEVIDRPVGTVRSRIHRARLDLKEKLRKFMDSEDDGAA